MRRSVTANGRVDGVQVWAPLASHVRVVVGRTATGLTRDGEWWRGADLAPGTDYAFLLDDSGEPLPDPASRWQPYGVHGASRVYDQSAHAWSDRLWRGRPLAGAVLYELHVGTFTPGATFDSAIERLDHLVALGITHVELLPVNAFNGIWNWGYDGVGWYAVHEPYGGPDGLKRFVDACHARGLAVILDVVYNHLGPSGNYLPRFAPYLKTDRNTWGDLLNFDAREVRDFVIENALMWLRDYHVDALRIDAVHALRDTAAVHVLAELSDRVRESDLGWQRFLIAESDLNDPMVVTPTADGGWGMDAQWDDDVHHALHCTLAGEQQGYYGDFVRLTVLATVMSAAFWHDGKYSTFRGRRHGVPVDRATTPGWRFIAALQNHDQVGNRAVGERLPELTTPGLLRVGAVLLLTSPFTPMLWMGEEWAARTRWPFFTSHPEPELAKATGEGRLAEFKDHGWDVTQMIDPQDPAAYRGAILDWSELDEPAHASILELYQELIRLRASIPDLRDADLSRVHVDYDEDARWLVVHRGKHRVIANLAPRDQTVPTARTTIILATGTASIVAGGVRIAAESAAIVAG